MFFFFFFVYLCLILRTVGNTDAKCTEKILPQRCILVAVFASDRSNIEELLWIQKGKIWKMRKMLFISILSNSNNVLKRFILTFLQTRDRFFSTPIKHVMKVPSDAII